MISIINWYLEYQRLVLTVPKSGIHVVLVPYCFIARYKDTSFPNSIVIVYSSRKYSYICSIGFQR